MPGRIYRVPHRLNIGGDTSRCFIVHNTDSFDVVPAVLLKYALDGVCVYTGTPIPCDQLRIESQSLSQRVPQRSEMSGLIHQYFIPGRQCIHQRGFPGTGTRRWKNNNRTVCSEYQLQAIKNITHQLLETWATVIDRGLLNNPQYAFRDIGRSRNL